MQTSNKNQFHLTRMGDQGFLHTMGDGEEVPVRILLAYQ